MIQFFQTNSLSVFVALITVSTLVGCGEKAPPVGELSGEVFFRDELVGDCNIVLFNPKTVENIGGIVDDNGAFKIAKIPVGDYQINLRQKVTNAIEEPPFDKRIPKKYRDRRTSGFEVTIKEGENSTVLEME